MTAPQWLRDLLQSTPVVCDAEADQSVMATVMSVGLVVGMVVSYLPQVGRVCGMWLQCVRPPILMCLPTRVIIYSTILVCLVYLLV